MMTARSAALGSRIGLTARLHQAITALDRFPPSILQLTSRIAIAAVFWSSGLIVVGLATRLAILPLLGITLVIEVFVYPEYWTMHLMWASVLLFLLTKGPGVFSLDHYFKRVLRGKRFVA